MKKRSLFRDTRALSHHFEMMISFVMFILFVFFVLLFVRPQDNNYLSESVIDGTYYNLFVLTQIPVVTFFVDVEDLNPSVIDCILLELPAELVNDEQYGSSIALRIAPVTDINSDVLLGVPVRIGLETGDGNNSYYIHLSDSFTDDVLTTCVFAPDTDYHAEFGGFRRDEMMSYASLEGLKSRYTSDYDNLRKDLGIPEVFDFSILVEDEIVMDIGSPTSSNVFARDFIQKVMYDDGHMEFKRITLKLWR